MKTFLPLLLVALGAAVLANCGRPDPAPPVTGPTAGTVAAEKGATWLTDLEAAKTQAREGNKMVLVNFTGSDWCPPCIMLRRQVFSHPEFAEYAQQNLVLVEIDFPRGKSQPRELVIANEKLVRQYGIEGFPTIVVLDSAGKTVGQLGYMSGGASRFLAELESLRPR